MNTQNLTLADRIWPQAADTQWLRGVALALIGSLLVAASAQVQVPLPVVPITLQSLAVLAVGAALGWRLAAAALVLYALEGVAGLPVFAGFKAGPAVLFGPTGGYILGFVLAAAAVGWLAERGFDRTIVRMFLAMLVGAVLIYVPGLPWLAQFTGWDKVLELGLYPFIWGDLIKATLAAVAFPAVWSLLGRR
jgi:biotin transport system substrate-specific component